MGRTKGEERFELVLVQLQVLQSGPGDYSAHGVADEAQLEVLELELVVDVVLDLDGQSMARLLDVLLGPALVGGGNEYFYFEGLLVFEEIGQVLHIVARGLIPVNKHHQVGLLVLGLLSGGQQVAAH